ncbi:hypothetical protein V5O48_003473 [Marasmius crinis-equi]|uniref:MYND-type domain-containing protein n=1 Tax=Marasmius crinis-equi TaxID=585013 RepID=A0ABR3FT85_9AGAR
MSFSSLLKDFRQKPPISVDLDRLNVREENAFKSMNLLADALKDNHLYGTSPYRFTRDNWSKIWPWLLTFCRCVLDRPSPTTLKGQERAFHIVIIAGLFTCYPIYQSNNDDYHTLLNPLLESTPRVLGLAFEMWLHGSTIEPPFLGPINHALGVLLEVHTEQDDGSWTFPRGEATDAFVAVLRDTERWDIPEACIRGIIQNITQPLVPVDILRGHLFIFSSIIRIAKPFVAKILLKDGVRWITAIVTKLSSPKNYSRDTVFDDIAAALRAAIHFLVILLDHDKYYVPMVLDEGILVSIFKARGIIIEDSRRRDLSCGLRSIVSSLLQETLISLVHQPVLVRACPRSYALDISHTFLRCSGCLTDVYCSEECQRLAWKRKGDPPNTFPHRMVCKARREYLQTGDGTREPSTLEFAGMGKQIAYDVLAHASDIKRLEDLYRLQHPTEPQTARTRLITWMDYSRHPIAMEAITVEEGERRWRHEDSESSSTSLDEGVSAMAKIPWRWRSADPEPILFIHRGGRTNTNRDEPVDTE